MALRMSCCMVTCRKYAFRVEHCLWVLPDRREEEKNYDLWHCYVLACNELTV